MEPHGRALLLCLTPHPHSGQMYRPVKLYLISRLHAEPDPVRSMRSCLRCRLVRTLRCDPSRARRPVNGAARSIRFAPVLAVSLAVTGRLVAPGLLVSRRFGINRTQKGEQDHESRETGRLHTRHRQNHRGPGAGRPHLDETLECGKHGGAHHAATASQRRAVFGHQHPDALGRGHRHRALALPSG